MDHKQAIHNLKQIVTLYKSASVLEETLEHVVDMEKSINALHVQENALRDQEVAMRSNYDKVEQQHIANIVDLEKQFEEIALDVTKAKEDAAKEKERVSSDLKEYVNKSKVLMEQWKEEVVTVREECSQEMDEWRQKVMVIRHEYDELADKINSLKALITVA